jgi:endonuclease/exonuclease/phosphatase family metal-dependent hydrolase
MTRPTRRLAADLAQAAIALGLLGALLGAALRDRVPGLAALTYVPVLPFAVLGLLAGLWRREGWRRWGYGLGAVAALAGVWSALEGLGTGSPPAPAADGATVIVQQQNVWWGGGPQASSATWRTIVDDLRAREADVRVLSEAPRAEELGVLRDALGPSWSMTSIENEPGARHLFHVIVASRWPVERRARLTLDRGVAMVVEVAAPTGPFVVLAVDGESDPRRDRTRMLDDVRRAVEAHDPDVIAGDLNAPSRSVGFDALRGHYWLASDTCGEWRATFPRPLPWLDLDHVWAATRWSRIACDVYDPPHSDHRGQVVTLARARR